MSASATAEWLVSAPAGFDWEPLEAVSSRSTTTNMQSAEDRTSVRLSARTSRAGRDFRGESRLIERIAIVVSVLLHLGIGWYLLTTSLADAPAPTAEIIDSNRVSVELLTIKPDQRPAPPPPMPVAPQRVQPVPTAKVIVEQSPIHLAPLAVAQPMEVVEIVEPTPVQTAEPQPVTPVTAPATAAEPINSARAKREQSDYVRTLMAWLMRHRTYPDAAKKDKAQGIVKVRFSIDRAGNVLSATAVSSSGSAVLDQAAVNVLRLASPVPPMPDSMRMSKLSITLPIEYSLTTD